MALRHAVNLIQKSFHDHISDPGVSADLLVTQSTRTNATLRINNQSAISEDSMAFGLSDGILMPSFQWADGRRSILR